VRKFNEVSVPLQNFGFSSSTLSELERRVLSQQNVTHVSTIDSVMIISFIAPPNASVEKMLDIKAALTHMVGTQAFYIKKELAWSHGKSRHDRR
jgi:hypothetical protein